IANIISEQTNTKAMLLHGAHNITKAEMEAGVSYLSIMNDNAIKLKEALHSD
ncbi:MAG: zinc ABC transporter substrate-binding protein, partial [Erysipelothrix sp.]|nr:zinc ABC transporter substrate-binding protein [Erysipelothrix sp.]